MAPFRLAPLFLPDGHAESTPLPEGRTKFDNLNSADINFVRGFTRVIQLLDLRRGFRRASIPFLKLKMMIKWQQWCPLTIPVLAGSLDDLDL